MILVLDIDGTLSNFSHRLHLLGDDPSEEEFEEFLDPLLVRADDPFPKAQKVFDMMRQHVKQIHFVTGRKEKLRHVTESWLLQHFDVLPTNDALHMRPNEEFTTASDHKRRTIERIIPHMNRDHETILFIDDDPFVLPMYQEYGIVLKAPECWDLMLHSRPNKKEELFSK